MTLLDASDLDAASREHELVTVSCRFQCASNGSFGGRWRGILIRDLLEQAPPETTHVRVWSADEYRTTVPIVDALDAVIAIGRLDAPTDGLPRRVGEELDSADTVQSVVHIEAVSLPPGVDP